MLQKSHQQSYQKLFISVRLSDDTSLCQSLKSLPKDHVYMCPSNCFLEKFVQIDAAPTQRLWIHEK